MELYREAHLSAEPARPQAPPRLPQADADKGRHSRAGAPSGQGPQAAGGLSPAVPLAGTPAAPQWASDRRVGSVAVTTLKTRADFLRIRGGRRWTTPAFALEAKSRSD